MAVSSLGEPQSYSYYQRNGYNIVDDPLKYKRNVAPAPLSSFRSINDFRSTNDFRSKNDFRSTNNFRSTNDYDQFGLPSTGRHIDNIQGQDMWNLKFGKNLNFHTFCRNIFTNVFLC